MITPAELADMLNVNPTTVRRHCGRGLIQGAEKIGRDWHIPIAGAEAYARDYIPYQALRTPRKDHA